MKNREHWKPSKYIYRKGMLIGSRDPKEVGVGSRLIVDLIAELYYKNLPQYTEGKLLDLGCGKVPLYILYKDLVTDNICVDWENTLHKNDYLDFACDLSHELPFKDGEFNTIILSDVLEHIIKPDHLCKEIARILAPCGKIIMNVPFYYRLHEKPHDYYRYTEFALRHFTESARLRVLLLTSIGGVPEIITDIFAKNILRVPYIGYFLAIFAQWLTLSLIKTKFGRKISKMTGKNFPFAYFLVAEKPE